MISLSFWQSLSEKNVLTLLLILLWLRIFVVTDGLFGRYAAPSVSS